MNKNENLFLGNVVIKINQIEPSNIYEKDDVYILKNKNNKVVGKIELFLRIFVNSNLSERYHNDNKVK